MPAEDSFARRLNHAMALSHVSRSQLAAVMRSPDGTPGVTYSAVAQLLEGRSKAMSAENCIRTARLMGVNPFWLATGEEAMREYPAPPPAPAPAPQFVAENVQPYMTPSVVLDYMGGILASVPVELRPAFGDLLAFWAKSGGAESRKGALLALLHARIPSRSGQTTTA